MSDVYIPQKGQSKFGKFTSIAGPVASIINPAIGAGIMAAGSLEGMANNDQQPQAISQGDAISRRIENYGTDQNILKQALTDVEQLPTPYRDKFRTPIYQAYMKSQQQG